MPHDPDSSFITTIRFGTKAVELAFGARALRWIEKEKGTSFLKEISAFQKFVDDPLSVTLGEIGFLIRAGHAHYGKDKIPDEDGAMDLLDTLAKQEEPDEGGADTLKSMLTKIGAAYTAGIPGIGTKSGNAQANAGGTSDGKDPSPSSTGTPS